jgi:hypothetical protein
MFEISQVSKIEKQRREIWTKTPMRQEETKIFNQNLLQKMSSVKRHGT